MKRIIFIMVAMMLSMAASAQTLNKTLYIVDGKVVSEEQAKTIKNEDVVSMNVIEGIESAVIINTTKNTGDVDALKLTVTGAVRNEEMDETEQVQQEVYKMLNKTRDVQQKFYKMLNNSPLFLVTDGKKTVKAESTKDVNPSDILYMTVIDFQSLDSAAAEQYKKYGDPSNGVIIIQVKDIKKYKKEK
ncbi:MAG: hypothetical protein IIW65_04845 [Alistipes sp.]|nr:hypothetical protein [Alistipes sp.]